MHREERNRHVEWWNFTCIFMHADGRNIFYRCFKNFDDFGPKTRPKPETNRVYPARSKIDSFSTIQTPRPIAKK